MTDRDTNLLAADSLLDENRFAEARDAYRSVLIAGHVSPRALGNLCVAETEERLAFRRLLSSLFPEDVECRLTEVAELISSNRAAHALRSCTELLEKTSSPKEQSLVRVARLRAAARCGDFQFFAEDFRAVWGAEATVEGMRRFRSGLLELVSGITDKRAIPVLRAMAADQLGTDSRFGFLAAKAAELEALESAQMNTG